VRPEKVVPEEEMGDGQVLEPEEEAGGRWLDWLVRWWLVAGYGMFGEKGGVVIKWGSGGRQDERGCSLFLSFECMD
jgi:hypothetical protein